jgi:hypothetical protein
MIVITLDRLVDNNFSAVNRSGNFLSNHGLMWNKSGDDGAKAHFWKPKTTGGISGNGFAAFLSPKATFEAAGYANACNVE